MKFFRYMCRNSLMKIRHIRMAAFIIIIFIITMNYQMPLRRFSQDMNYPCSMWVFPFLMTRDVYLILFYFAVIYVNTDIPFMQHSNMYQMIRIGRRKYALAQMGGILVRSFAMVMLTVMCSIVTLLPRIEVTKDWGKLIRTIASTDKALAYNLEYNFTYDTLKAFTPLQLMGISIGVITLIVTFLGLLMYAICLYVNRICAAAAATGMSIMLFFVVNFHVMGQLGVSRWVPTVWAQLAKVKSPRMTYYWLPSIPYMVCFLLTVIGILGIIIVYKVKYVEFDWEKEDL